jgi:hypothetical protein
MRGENGGELELLARGIVEHRPRLAGIDDGGVRFIAQRPDIVVLERGNRNDTERNSLEHVPVFLRAKRGAEV